MRSITMVAGVAALVVGWSSALGTAHADPPPTPPPAPKALPAPKTTIDADGTYAVGADIVPGTYASAGPIGDGVCYWKRADGANDMLDNAMTKKPQVVAVAPTDASFKTTGCQAWLLTDAAPPGQMPPVLGGLKMQAYLGILNGMAGGMGQVPAEPPPPAPAPAPLPPP